ncbi:MAG: signal peptidase I [Bacteriovorax sp.]|nr:signal peptidase I [Bacteriovorax sp.]
MRFSGLFLQMFKPKSTNGMNSRQKLISEVKSIILIIIAVLTFRSVFFEPFRIPSGSMIPTLMIGDFILVNKFAYGLKVPFTDFVLGETSFNPIYVAGKSDPKRGDVVVFKYPKDLSVNYIKRVIGLPGDTLEIRNKVVYINDKAIEPHEIDGKATMADMDDKFKGYNLKFYKVKTGEHEHVIQQDNDNYFKVDFDKITIPAGKFFMMGDNRDFSYDSRYWGFINHEQIKGRAMFVWFSFIFPFGENPMKFRPGRIGTPIN